MLTTQAAHKNETLTPLQSSFDTVDSAAEQNRYFCFQIKAAHDPQTMLRLLGLFAQRNIVPLTISCQAYVETQDVRLVATGLSKKDAQIIAAKMTAMVTVIDVNLTD